MIKLLLQIKSSFPSLKISSYLRALEVDITEAASQISWLNGRMTNLLTEAIWPSRFSRHSGTWALEALEGYLGKRQSKGTQGNWAFGTQRALGNSDTQGTWAPKALRRSKGTRAPKALRYLGTQALGYSSTQKALGHLGTQGTLFRWLFERQFYHSSQGDSSLYYRSLQFLRQFEIKWFKYNLILK